MHIPIRLGRARSSCLRQPLKAASSLSTSSLWSTRSSIVGREFDGGVHWEGIPNRRIPGCHTARIIMRFGDGGAVVCQPGAPSFKGVDVVLGSQTPHRSSRSNLLWAPSYFACPNHSVEEERQLIENIIAKQSDGDLNSTASTTDVQVV
eukprot:358731-Amphidinium_carterae.1